MPYPASATYPGGAIYPGDVAPPVDPPPDAVSNLLRPNADGDKAEWTEVPPGAAYTCLDEVVIAPAVPTTTDRIETATGNEISRIRFETFEPTRSVTGATAYAYLKPGSVSVRADLNTGSTLLEQGATFALTGGMHLGANEDYDQWYATGGHQAGAPVLASMGATCARWPVFWFNHQFTEGGAYNWQGGAYTTSPYDAILAAGLLPVVVVCGAPDFAGAASGSGGLRIPDAGHIDDFAAFIAALQAHLPEAVLQVWNEPNYTLFGNGATAAHLADMTNAASEAIQPTEIIAPAMSPGGEQEASAYFNTMWDAITEDAYVKAAAHIYPSGPAWVGDINNWLTRLNQRSPGRGWITEAGIHRDLHGGDTNQNFRSKTLYQMASDAGLEGMVYHRFRTSDDNTFEVEGDFGVVNLALSGQNFVPNSLFDAIAEARVDDPNVAPDATYRWVSTPYVGTLSQTDIDALEVQFVSGGAGGGDNAEVAATYVVVDLLPLPPAPVRPTLVVDAVRDGSLSVSHRLATRVDVLENGSKVAEIDTVLSGSVSMDSRAASRARCDITLVDDGTMGWVPSAPDDLLAPFGNELRILRGIEFADQTELVSLGIFGIDRASTQNTGAGIEISVSGLDRSWRFLQAPFEAPQQFGGTGQATHAAIVELLTSVWSDLPYDFDNVVNDAPLPLSSVEEGQDRWGFCQGLGLTLKGELFFDDNGVLRLLPIPDPGGMADAALVEGIDGTLLGVNREWDRADIYNRVIVTGENLNIDGPVPRGIATDTDPSSPTLYGAKFGRKPYFYANQWVASDAAAVIAAEGLLARMIGAPDVISFGSVVDPSRRPGDVITIERPLATEAGVEKHILDQVTIPLGAEGEMNGQTRAARVLLSE